VDNDFEEYVRAQTRALLRLAYILTGDGHLAEDVVQESLARVHGRWGRIRQAGSPHAYVRRVVVNEVRSRQRRRRVFLVFRSPEHIPDRQVFDTGDAASERDDMWALVSALPPRQRAVLVLRYYEGLPDQEIAETLSISPVTVRTTASRALAALRASPGIAHHLSPSETPTGSPGPTHQPAPCTQESR
jgi:RNA polymerase sigma-70 factor (sigma-E family)